MEYARGNVVLVIDDDEINLSVARMVLEKKLPCKVLTAEDGAAGLDILRRQRVSAVLLDIEMPFMDGFETLAQIRADKELRGLPVLMLTASADKETIRRVMRQGVADYIKKPFLPADLVERVGRFLSEEQGNPRVLVVDDEADVRAAIRRIIDESLPFETLEADSGIAALTLLKQSPADVVLLDMAMPFMDGPRTLGVMGMSESLADTRVILLASGPEEEEAAQEELENSPLAAGWLPKPPERDALVAKVAAAARR